MKKYIYILLFSLAFNTCFASKVMITVKNLSPFTITMTRADGTNITLAPYDEFYNVPFRTRTYVSNYIEGKLVCQWYIHSSLSEVTHALIYNPEYARRSGNNPCTKIATRLF